MSESLIPPVLLPDAQAVGIDLVCREMQTRLATLPFLGTHSLGRIHPQMTEDGKRLPWLFRGTTGEYYPAYPNDTLDAFSCLLAHDDERYNEGGYFATRTVSVICWLNLSKLPGSPRTVESAKWQVIDVLMGFISVFSADRSYDQASDGGDRIYPGFDLSGLRTQYMSWPYGAFRVEFTVNYAKPNLC